MTVRECQLDEAVKRQQPVLYVKDGCYRRQYYAGDIRDLFVSIVARDKPVLRVLK